MAVNRNSHSRTIGPVPDMERYVPLDWWRTLFNAIYLKTDGDVVENDVNTVRDVNMLIHAAKLTPGDKVLDLCCGQGRHCIELARRGFRHITGLDRSRYLIRLARKRAEEFALAVTFREGDARRLRFPENSFDCVALMGSSFGYFHCETEDLAVLAGVRRVLRSGGTIAMDLTDGEWICRHFEPRSWEWIDQKFFVCRERSLSADRTRLICREVVTHAEKGVIADQFYAERLYSRRRIHQVLRQMGFTSVEDCGLVATDSNRNQDLGMMAHRMFLTARVKEET